MDSPFIFILNLFSPRLAFHMIFQMVQVRLQHTSEIVLPKIFMYGLPHQKWADIVHRHSFDPVAKSHIRYFDLLRVQMVHFVVGFLQDLKFKIQFSQDLIVRLDNERQLQIQSLYNFLREPFTNIEKVNFEIRLNFFVRSLLRIQQLFHQNNFFEIVHPHIIHSCIFRLKFHLKILILRLYSLDLL